MDPLLALTCAALSGIAARPPAGHGVPPVTAEARAAEALELARAAEALLTAPEQPKHTKGPRR